MNNLLPTRQSLVAAAASLFLLSATAAHSDSTQTADTPSGCVNASMGLVIHIDPQTGRPTQTPTAEQARAMASTLAAQAGRSPVGLVQEVGPTGGVRVNLQGRFRNPLVASINQDGSVTHTHVNCGRPAVTGKQGG